MKKLSLIIVALFCITYQSQAQNCFNIFQENVILKKIQTSEVDSITVTETEPHIVSFWHNGSVSQSYNTEEIDSITVTIDEDPLSYIGIVGFNNELYISEMDVLAKSTSGFFRSFVNNLSRKDGTLLYYAVDNALDMLDASDITTPLSSVNLITFTDGLDQGSIMMNSKYSSSRAYLDAIGDIIGRYKYNGLPINAYSVGLRGNDVSDMETFRDNLARLASSADKSFEVSNINDIRSKFQDIANQIISISMRQTISLKIPGIDSGTRVRFVFDGQSAESSDLYIEGIFNLSDRTLRNVTYHGMKSRSGSMVQGTQDGIFVTFTFMGLQREDVGQTIPTSIRHYYMLSSSSTWQQNSEFTPDNNTRRTVSHVGTIVVLVLDCSGSLGSDFSNVQQYANEFIDMIANNAQPFEVKAPENAKAELDEEAFNIVICWDAVKHAESYQIYRGNSSNGSYSLVADNVAITTWADESPLAGYNYYRIKATGHGLTSSNSNTTDAINYALDAPTNAKAELDDENFNIAVSWDAVMYAEKYQVYRGNSSNGIYSLVADNITSTTWTDESPFTGYNYYRIKALGHGLTSGDSNTTNMIDYKLEAPTNAKVVWDDNDDMVVSWNAVRHAESYQVYRSNKNDNGYTLAAENITSTSWTDKNPLSGYNYYRIKALGHGLTSSESNTTNVVNYVLDAPANAKAELDDEAFNVVVTWEGVRHAERYQVYRSGSSNGSYTLMAEIITPTTWTDKNPLSGSNYYRIKALGHGLTSPESNTTNMIDYKLEAPTNAKVVWDDNDDVVVSWDAVKHAEIYQVYRSGSSNGNYSLDADYVTTTNWIDSTPLSGNNYYRIMAFGYGLTSGNSNTTVLNYALDAPKNAKAELDDKNSKVVIVFWDAVRHAEAYQVYRSNSSNGSYTLVSDNIISTTWTDKTPLSGYNYYRIKAVGHGLTSGESNTSNDVVVWPGDYVDLDLPSGTLWATCNIGADSPEDCGDYFAWGETQPKSKYSLNTYFDKSYTKYTKSGQEELLPEDDAAYVNWGSNWRMPTKAQLDELHFSCTWTRTSLEGVNGYLVTGPNGNSIFLPDAGYAGDSPLESTGPGGRYWSRSLYWENTSRYAWCLMFDSGIVSERGYNRYYGRTVRPVRASQ